MSFLLRVPKKRRRNRQDQVGRVRLALRSYHSESSTDNFFLEGRISRELPNGVTAELEAIARPETYSKGEVLFVEGQRSSGVFLLREGQVKLSVGSADGKSLMVGKAGPGDVLGLPTAVSGERNELTAEALTQVESGFVPREEFLEFFQEHGAVALRVAEILSEMYASALDHVRYLGLSASTSERLARLLLDLPAGEPGEHGDSRGLTLTHREIAEMIGASRETVTRMFARFRRENLVEAHSSGFRVTDRAGLEELLARL